MEPRVESYQFVLSACGVYFHLYFFFRPLFQLTFDYLTPIHSTLQHTAPLVWYAHLWLLWLSVPFSFQNRIFPNWTSPQWVLDRTPATISGHALYLAVPTVGLKTGLILTGRERPKKDHSRLVDGIFNKEGNLHTRLVLGSWKMSRFLHLPPKS